MRSVFKTMLKEVKFKIEVSHVLLGCTTSRIAYLIGNTVQWILSHLSGRGCAILGQIISLYHHLNQGIHWWGLQILPDSWLLCNSVGLHGRWDESRPSSNAPVLSRRHKNLLNGQKPQVTSCRWLGNRTGQEQKWSFWFPAPQPAF